MTIEQQVQQAAELAGRAEGWSSEPNEDSCARCREEKTSEWNINGLGQGNHGQFADEAQARLIAHCNPEFISKWAAYTRSLASLLDSVDPFSAGRDGDRCIWCNRDRPISLQTWEGRWDEEHHDTDCDAANFFAKYRATDSKGDRNNG